MSIFHGSLRLPNNVIWKHDSVSQCVALAMYIGVNVEVSN